MKRPQSSTYILRLFINNSTVKSTLAVTNLTRVCEQYLKGRYRLEVIDIHRQADVARTAQIVAVPTLIKQLPVPLRRVVGDMSDVHKVLSGLDLHMEAA
jgi:circadian clock protein KaiB